MANLREVESRKPHMAEDKAQKAKVNALTNVFCFFNELGSDDEQERVEAGVNLLHHLLRKQNESESTHICPEIHYALKRMVRGVCSRHIPKRAGFFSVLVETLKFFDTITAQDVMDLVEKEYEDEMSAESCTGRLLAFGALIRANTFLKAPTEEQAVIIEKLLSVGQGRAVFWPCVYSFIVDLMEKIDDSKFEEVVWLHLKPQLSTKLEEHTVDSLWVLFEARNHFPSVVKKKFLLRNLGNKDIVYEESVSYYSKLLMDAPATILNNHAFYEILIPQVVSSDFLIPFWESLVKKVEENPTPQREKALISSILKLLPLINKELIPELLCDGFMDLVIKIYQNRKKNLELIADISGLLMNMTSILKSDEIDEDIKLSFLKRLILFPGPFTFDAFDGIKITVQLWPSMSIIGMEQIGSILKNIIVADEHRVKNLEGGTCLWNRRERSYAIKLFSKLLSITVQEDKLKWKIKELKFMVSQGFISSSKSDVVDLGIASEVRNNFFRVLDPALSPENQSVKVLSSLVHHINSLIFTEGNSSRFYQHLSESSLSAWKKMFELVKKLQSVEMNGTDSKMSGNKLFILLFLHMGLQLLRDATLAEEALQELHSCYERTQNDATNSRKKRRSIKNGEDDPHWVEVMMDLFISLLSHNSALHRSIVGSVFPHLCPYLTPTSIHQLLEVLDPNADKILMHDDSEDESSEESEAEDESSSKKILSEDEKDDDDEEEEEEEDDDDDDDLEDDDAPVNDQLKIAVQNALKKAMINGRDSDEESIDMDQMTEEERNRLDAALSEAFKLVKYTQSNKKSKKQSKDDESLMYFRIRVLDLIVLYLSKKPDLGLVLDMIFPLFDLLEFCIKDNHQITLEKRVRSCLMKLCHVKQFSNVSGVNEKIVSEVIAKLLQKGQRVAAVYQIMKTPLCKCSAFLVRTYLHIDPESHQDTSRASPILDVYKEALVSFFTNRDSLLPVEVFGNVLMITWMGAWTLADIILSYTFTSACRPFRRSQALQLLNKFFCNRRLLIDASKNGTKVLYKMEKTILEKAVQVLVNVVNGKQNEHFVVKQKNIEELLGLLLAIHKIDQQNKEKVANAAHWNDVKDAILQYWQCQNFGNVIKSNLRKLASALNIKLVEVKKQNKCNNVVGDTELENINQQVANDYVESLASSEDNGDKGYESGNGMNDENDIEKQPMKKRKRGKSDEKRNRNVLKKKAKYTRMATMSDGLEASYKFSELQLEEETPKKADNFPDERKRKMSDGGDVESEKSEQTGGKTQKLEEDSGNSEKLRHSGKSRKFKGIGRNSEKSEDGTKRHKKPKTVEEVNENNIKVSKTDKKFQMKLKRGEKKEKRKTNMEHEEKQRQCI